MDADSLLATLLGSNGLKFRCVSNTNSGPKVLTVEIAASPGVVFKVTNPTGIPAYVTRLPVITSSLQIASWYLLSDEEVDKIQTLP